MDINNYHIRNSGGNGITIDLHASTYLFSITGLMCLQAVYNLVVSYI